MRLINIISAERGIYTVPEKAQDDRSQREIILAWLHVEDDGKDYVLGATDIDMCNLHIEGLEGTVKDIRERMRYDDGFAHVIVTGASR